MSTTREKSESISLPTFDHSLVLSIVENLKDVVFQTDAEGRWTFLNPAWTEITGFTVAESMGESFLQYIHAEDRRRNQELFQPLIERRKEYCRHVVRYLTRDGGFRWIEVFARLTIDATDTIIGTSGTLSDVTEHHQLTEELKRSNQALQEFASVASHDLQEPLSKITAFGGRLKKITEGNLSSDGTDYLCRMLNAANRMQSLISGLLEYARITTQEQTFAPTNLNEVLQGVLSDLEIKIMQSSARVLSDPLPILEADPLQMRQLFQNLLGNALKFTRPGIPPIVTIRVENYEPMGWVRIIISDNGIGFEASHENRIFEVFERLHGRGAYEGTGIGLALCRRIVERHGGTIRAFSQLEAGASFIIELPCGSQEEGTSHHDASQE